MGDSNVNPMGNIYSAFMKILEGITIKYVYRAEEYETTETKLYADEYFDALNKKDTFFTYIDYTQDDYAAVGLRNYTIVKEALTGNTDLVPPQYREPLLQIKRARVIDSFVEENNYYRVLNGQPPVEDDVTDYYYITDAMSREYGIDKSIPIHDIQDHYNAISETQGDYYISLIEGSGYIQRLIAAHPDQTYLKYIGSSRIDLEEARLAKNFQILQLKHGTIKQSLYDEFMQIYDQCREYFMKTIYIPSFRTFIDYYDNFIAMCIMLMTIQQVIMRQISLGVKREFFDLFAVKALYQTYDVPYNLNIDEETQSDLIQNLNLMVQNKATNKVIYNIAYLLGFSNINVYKYFLTKEQKYDIYGVPIVKYIERFNNDTGEVYTAPDFQAMYDIYFQKSELKEDDITSSFTDVSNKVKYEDITIDDPYWWDDENLYDRIWETEYNFVESKYLSLGISYSMTDVMFENIILLKLLLQKGEELDDVRITLPRILETVPVSLFDTIILLVCLTACKHNLVGEIITIPTQVIAVLDYMKNVEETDMLVDTFSFDFDYFSPTNEEGQKHIATLKKLLGKKEYEEFMGYISILSFENCPTPNEKIDTLNKMYANIKGLYRLLNYEMTNTTDRKTYECLKQMYRAAFYSKELRSAFTITGEITGEERTAWTYFEFLYHHNPMIYNAIFEVDLDAEYSKYLKENSLLVKDFSYEDFLIQIELGNIIINYDHLKGEVIDDTNIKDEKVYFYVNHIISRLEMVIKNLKYVYLLNDSATPLEKLLVKLVRFFKSYTVDILGLDTLLIFDLKPENMIRLFDEIWYMEKTIGMDEQLKISYSDVLHKTITELPISDDMKLKDKLFHDVYLLFDEFTEWTRNSMRLKDELSIEKTEQQDDQLDIFDVHKSLTSSINVKDKNTMNDRMLHDNIAKIWYSS